MKAKFFCILLLTITASPFVVFSQIFWCDNFDSGGPACNNQGAGWTLNIPGPSTNDVEANEWVVNNQGNCSICDGFGLK